MPKQQLELFDMVLSVCQSQHLLIHSNLLTTTLWVLLCMLFKMFSFNTRIQACYKSCMIAGAKLTTDTRKNEIVFMKPQDGVIIKCTV